MSARRRFDRLAAIHDAAEAALFDYESGIPLWALKAVREADPYLRQLWAFHDERERAGSAFLSRLTPAARARLVG